MKFKSFLLAFVLCMIISGVWLSWDYYTRIYKPNVELDESSVEFFVHTDWDYDKVCTELENQGIVTNVSAFQWVADRKSYPDLVKPGRYLILDGMSNNALVNLLRSGEQQPIRLIIRSVRSKEEFAAAVGKDLEADENEILNALNDPNFCDRFGFNTTTIFTMFIPNTYEFYWNTSAEEFFERMRREYKRFWNADRQAKAKKLGLGQSEVATLASIVQSEQGAHPDERPKVAGLYLNRLRKGMRLESDPTLIYALNDYSIKRVLLVHREIESPYNTYKYSGLPPGPIMLPETTSIDAVLNAEQNNYIFMCAREDFSGYHNFSSNYEQHMIYARRYQKALNERKIFR